MNKDSIYGIDLEEFEKWKKSKESSAGAVLTQQTMHNALIASGRRFGKSATYGIHHIQQQINEAYNRIAKEKNEPKYKNFQSSLEIVSTEGETNE